MAKKMRITRVTAPPFNPDGDGLDFHVQDEEPKKIYSWHAKEIRQEVRVCGGDVSGYVVTTWDGRRVEVNGSKLESVEWKEDTRGSV